MKALGSLQRTEDTSKILQEMIHSVEQAGADFVKTSTGFAPGGSEPEDLKVMRDNVSDSVEIKAAGSVRDLDDVIMVRSLGVTRVGATQTEKIMNECIKRFDKI